MNYKPLVKKSIEDFMQEHDYSYTKMIYSAMMYMGVRTRGDLINSNDEDFYLALQKAREEEKEEEFSEKDLEQIEKGK